MASVDCEEVWAEGADRRLTEPQVMFLGTSCMASTNQRSVSAVYLFSGSAALLMDCGQGTYAQLVDYFDGDFDKVATILRKTRVVHISHYHADHVLGLARVLKERDKVLFGNRTEQRAMKGDNEQSRQEEDELIFVIVPPCLLDYANHIVKSLERPEFVRVLPSHMFNPEANYLYQKTYAR